MVMVTLQEASGRTRRAPAKAGQGNVWVKTARFYREATGIKSLAQFAVERTQGFFRRHPGPQVAGLTGIPKTANARGLHEKRLPRQTVQGPEQPGHPIRRDLPQETQGQVKLIPTLPAGAVDSLPPVQQVIPCGVGQGQSQKQSRHTDAPQQERRRGGNHHQLASTRSPKPVYRAINTHAGAS